MTTNNQTEEKELFDLLPESVIKVDKYMKITFKNKFFSTHYAHINDLNFLIGNNEPVFFINSKYEPLELKDLPEAIVFKSLKGVNNLIVGSNDTINRTIKWLNISSRPILDKNNECQEVISVIKDITSFYISEKESQMDMQMYKDHLEKSGEYIFRIGFYPKKHFLYVSPNIHETFGYTVEEYMENPNLFIEKIHSDDFDIYKSLLEDNFKIKNRARLRFVAKNGSIKWCDISYFPRFYSNSNELEKLEGIISNITDYKHKKTELEIKEKILQGIVNKSNSFQFSYHNDEKSTIHFLDHEFEKVTGFLAESFLGNSKNDFDSLIHFQDREMVRQEIDRCISENRVWNIEYRLKHVNGDYIWVKEYGLSHKDENDQLINSGIVANIQKTKISEEKSETITRNYENIVNNSKLGTWEWNIENGETVFNEQWAQIIGYTLEELSPINIDTWINLTHPTDLEKSNLLLQKHFNGETELYECEARMRHKSGDWIWVRDTGRVISSNSKGDPISMSGVHQDITKFKMIEENLHKKIEFEKILANVSKNFIAGDVNFDLIINNAFEELGQHTNASRIYIFLLQDNKQIMDNTHEWCARGVNREIDNLQNLPTSIFPWWMERLYRGEIIQISDVSKMPFAAKAEKEILESQNIKSLLVVGLRVRGELIGFIGFDDVNHNITKWDKEKQFLLLWMSQIFSSVFENKWNQNKLIKSERKFRNIFDKNPIPQLLIDPANGEVLDSNSAAQGFYGYSEQELLTKNLVDLSFDKHQKERVHLKDVLDIIINNSYLEYQQTTANNKLRKVELFSGMISIDQTDLLHLIIHDITNQYTVLDRNTILRSAIDNSPFGVMILNIIAEVEDMNQKAMAICGYQLDDIKGKHLSILDTRGFSLEYFSDAWEHVLDGRVWKDEISRRSKSGEIYWISFSLIPVFNTNNDIHKVVLIEENIDGKRKQLLELKEAKKAAEESNHLKSAFLSTINHELRTPLNHIIGLSDIIDEMSTDESISEYSKIINKSGLNLLEMIEDILTLTIYDHENLFAKKDNIKIIDLFLSLKERLREIHSKSNKQNSIELKFNTEARFMNHDLISDQNKITMIFNNLFENAIKYTESGSIEFGFKTTNQKLELYVKDTGIGIPEDKKEIIFDFFRQADDINTRMHEGLGIGLSIAQRAAKALGTNIRIESKEGEGSTFSLLFDHPELFISKSVISEHSKTAIPDFSDKKILIVDDDDDSLLVSMMFLDKTHINCRVAGNGKIALDIINNETFDLVLMDLKMPEMDGFEATRLIKKLIPEQIIIGLTAYSFIEEKNNALEAGCSEVLAKPINKLMLYKVLEKHLLN